MRLHPARRAQVKPCTALTRIRFTIPIASGKFPLSGLDPFYPQCRSGDTVETPYPGASGIKRYTMNSMIGDIDTADYLEELRTLASRYDLPIEAMEAVPSIQGWCQKRNAPEESPFRTARLLRNDNTGCYLILLARLITADMVSSVTGAMLLRGFASEVELLSDARAFLWHLLLHEIAHGLDEARSEADCDRWAFEQLRLLASNRAFERDAQKARPPQLGR